jgi:hypothetical protein
MKVSFRFVYIALSLALLTSCGNNSAKSSTADKTETKADTSAGSKAAASVITDKTINTNPHNKLNDVALYLAGMKPDSFVAIPARLQNLPFYKQYCDTMDKGFGNIETNRLSKMRDWAKTELAPELANPKTVLYPFSGPDILHCVQFFPDADQYIMIALERYGSLPNMEKMDSTRTIHTLNYIHQSLEDIIGKSYFITVKMALNVSNQYNGVTPLACVFLVRSGYSILDIKYKHLLDDGKTFVEIPLDSMGHHVNDCVEIYFRKNGKDKIQKLTYFKANIADTEYLGAPGLKDNTGFRSFLDSLPQCYTYTKSASYRMCQTGFSVIRNTCLNKSKTMLQDDTGIAFAFFAKDKWKITLYGNYEKPISDFQGGYYQPGLQAAYKADSANIKPLPFSLGYHWKDAVQNLMKFEKK